MYAAILGTAGFTATKGWDPVSDLSITIFVLLNLFIFLIGNGPWYAELRKAVGVVACASLKAQ